MAGSVRDLPGIRVGANLFVFSGDDEEGAPSRIEDFDADWVAIAAPGASELGGALSAGDPVELEVPLPSGSLFLVGRVTGHKLNRIKLVTVRVEEVGADPEVGLSREARRHFRQPLWLPLRRLAFRRSPDGEWRELGGIVRDISSGGLSIYADGDVPAGCTVYVDCPVPLDAMGLTLYGTAVGSRRTGTDHRPRYIVNVRFDTLSRHGRTWLAAQLQRYQWLTRWRDR